MAKKAARQSRELVFSDGKSNKFWNIELNGSSYTITFGRVGTSGKSQEKNFDSADAAEKAFEKLVAEKLKKGYRSAAGDSKSDDSLKPKEKKELQPARETQKANKQKAGPTKAMTTSDRAKVLKLLRERTTENAQLAFALLASFDLKPSDYSEIFTDTALAELFKLKRGQTVGDAFPFWECLLTESCKSETLHTRVCSALAIKLSNFVGWLVLNGLTSLSDAAAESLGKYKGPLLWLNGLTSLSNVAAESLSKYKDELRLDGLTCLSDAAAESLSKHEGSLHLDGLTSLSDTAAESLSKHEGDLILNGLTSLSDTAAESLSKHKGELYLAVLTWSDSVAKSLDKHGRLQLSEEAEYALQSFRYIDDAQRSEVADPPGTTTNSIGMKLVPIPAGTFLMGSPEEEEDRSNDEVQHEVTLTKDFYLGMTQVTQAQYEKVMGKRPSKFQGDEVSGRDSSEFPVETVSWYDAVEFCEKLSSLPEEKKAGRVYRLPTEAEWEYACRAGSTTAFSFGGEVEFLDDYAWYGNKLYGRKWCGRTHPVALMKPNGWGLYDMHGNVEEWCADWYGDYPKDAVNDPTGPIEGSMRVNRGGCWVSTAASCRSAERCEGYPPGGGNSLGFRIALSSSGVNK
jgi:formylglycine-generating enzyme required for sulfatase activity/predicted DNA-binding WGR domain protein